MALLNELGTAKPLFQHGLDMPFDATAHPRLSDEIVKLRPRILQDIKAAGLGHHVWHLEQGVFNPAFSVLDNLLFATQLAPLTTEGLAEQTGFLALLKELKISDTLTDLSVDIMKTLQAIFGLDGVSHPLFLRLGLNGADYERAHAVLASKPDLGKLTQLERAQLLIVPFSISAEGLGSSFPADIVSKIVEINSSHGAVLRQSMKDLCAPIAPDQPIVGLSVLENALFGRVSQSAIQEGDSIRRIVAEVLRDAGLDSLILALMFETPIGLNGTKLPAQFYETLALSRACLKKPDVLVLEGVLASQDASVRASVYANLHRLLPQTTLICIEAGFDATDQFDMFLEIKEGRLATGGTQPEDTPDHSANADLDKKITTLRQSDLFSTLDRKQLSLLAFGARWHHAKAGEYIFYKGDDPSSGAYLIVEGEADLRMPQPDGDSVLVTTVGPSKLVGELGLIRNEPRALDMRAINDLTSLRIGADAFLAVVENDALTAFKLLQVVAGYVGK